MNRTSKAKFTANSSDFYQTCYFQLPVTPSLSFHPHTAATYLHGNPSRSVPWEREWAELTSVWTLARGQCQHTNMALSILPYGAIPYVLQVRAQEWGPDVSCWSDRDQIDTETCAASDPWAKRNASAPVRCQRKKMQAAASALTHLLVSRDVNNTTYRLTRAPRLAGPFKHIWCYI